MRPTVPEDLPLILGWIPTRSDMVLWSGSVFSWPLDLDQLRADLEAAPGIGRALWTAMREEGTALGCASVIVSADGATGRLERMLINPLKRGGGQGHRLVYASVAAAFTETDIDLLTLALAEHDRAATHLYEHLGFRETGIVFDQETDGRTWRSVELACTRSDVILDGMRRDDLTTAGEGPR